MNLNYLIVMPQITQIKDQYYIFPIGTAYVSSSLKASGRNVTTLNLNYKETPLDILKQTILNNDIDVITVGGLTSQYNMLKEIVDTAKSIKSDIITIVGGGIITSDPIPGMQALETADYGVIGEGEITMCELAGVLENHTDLTLVDGIVFHNGTEWSITKPRKEIMDLDSLPYPDYEGFEYGEVLSKKPSDIYSFMDSNVLTMTFGRSCPYNCTFCFHPSGSKYRQRSLDSVFTELDYLISNYTINNLAITDELFARNFEYAAEFCKRIKQYNIGWIVSLRVDIVSKELATMLRDSGCLSVNLGLESADNRILKSMRKNITIEQIDNALSILYEVGLNAQGNFIFGDLEETLETASNTIRWWEAHPQYQIHLHWIVVYPGSYLYKVACEKGIIKDKVQYIKDGCPYINVSKMSDDEFKQLSQKLDTISPNRINFKSNVKIHYKSYGKVDIISSCPNCESENKWTNLDVFWPMTNIVCGDCKKVMNILVADYIDNTFDDNIKLLLKRGKVAVWPVTYTLVNVFAKAPSLQSTDAYIVDSSPFKQGNEIFGKKVYSPEVIRSMNIKSVIIPISTSVASEIYDIIKHTYPNVQNIYFAGELIKPIE
ncbi:Radical SAM domain protein [Syntrophobotulus glycolicus DSM 8271]|uniref:Radical SAM domain protein n=1 Tax=Syntrophobotulus glycolicus (strain DSM 8271 / FlGlyR) TaxID=645991 RepID=F0SZC5_SYNGF|nr:B12-binding domain-containing radical SAM protein [Syntrophobotulus glycolicus]ADY54930.1 Radical SAM domain protein [Syntrophobotulus glycolicus DSM 8271]